MRALVVLVWLAASLVAVPGTPLSVYAPGAEAAQTGPPPATTPEGSGGSLRLTGAESALLRAAQSVLDARVAAFRRGDRDAWLATVDPAASAEFRAAQGRQFDGFRALPVAELRLTARLDDSGDLASAAASRYGAARVFLPETRLIHRFAGYDDRPAVDTLWLTFVERSGRWYVGGDTDVAHLGLETSRGPWDFGPLATLDTDHFLVVHHPDQASRAAALAGIAEEAATMLARSWGHAWSGKIPVIVPASVDDLEELLQSTVDLDNFVAFVSYGVLRDRAYEPTAPRIYVQDRNLARYGRRFQVETLVHELVHAASVPLAGPFIPAWVHEGVADWVAVGRPTGERRPRGSDGRLPRDFEFTTGPRDAIVRSYAESRSATSFLAGDDGLAAPLELFKVLGEVKVAPGTTDHHLDAALQRVAGEPFSQFEPAWARRR